MFVCLCCSIEKENAERLAANIKRKWTEEKGKLLQQNEELEQTIEDLKAQNESLQMEMERAKEAPTELTEHLRYNL